MSWTEAELKWLLICMPISNETYSSINGRNDLPWFFKNGKRKPKPEERNVKSNLGPEKNAHKDRIIQQLMSVPENYKENTSPVKIILVWFGLKTWLKKYTDVYSRIDCPVNRCFLTDDRQKLKIADAILFLDYFELPSTPKPRNQVWIYRSQEAPNRISPINAKNFINWTMTHRKDSDIPIPYKKWIYYDESVQRIYSRRNYAANKTGQVAWVVSNCYSTTNERNQYAKQLQKYIAVDIYGTCGTLKCSSDKNCFQSLGRKYKFYLAFENSNCIEYISEKFFFNGLENNMLPIVMGARPKDYASAGPRHSYIHVDDFSSPKELAQFLHKLDADDDLYNTYFSWKGTGEFIDTMTYSWCALCAMLHEPIKARVINDVHKWWTNNTCIETGPWPKNS